MKYQYVVVLRRTSERKMDGISFLLCLFSAANFLFAFFLKHDYGYFLLAAAIVVMTGAIGTLLSKRRFRRFRYWLLVSALGWLAMPYLSWLCILFLLLTFLEYQAKYPLEIGFAQDHVMINTLFKKKIAWSDFSNVILKDGLLTLDFKNNRIIQKEVDEEEEGEADEDEFNDFCRQMMARA